MAGRRVVKPCAPASACPSIEFLAVNCHPEPATGNESEDAAGLVMPLESPESRSARRQLVLDSGSSTAVEAT